MKIGIEKISFHIPRQYLELSRLAEQHGTDMLPKEELIYLDMTFEEASKFIVSAGTSNPKN